MKNILIVCLLFSLNSKAQPTILEVYNECIKQHVLAPWIVTAQSIQECGWHYESKNARIRNNLFGLWNSSKQEYFLFNHWTESVIFYKNKIQNRLKRGESYYKFLKRIGYAEANDYICKVKLIVKKLLNEGTLETN